MPIAHTAAAPSFSDKEVYLHFRAYDRTHHMYHTLELEGLWRELMGGEADRDMPVRVDRDHIFTLMLGDVGRLPSPRDALVSTSLVCWRAGIGSRGFAKRLKTAQAELAVTADMSSLYKDVWRIENESAFRLNEEGPMRQFPPSRFVVAYDSTGLTKPEPQEKVTARDLHVMTQVMAWLGTDEGQVFEAKCDAALNPRFGRQENPVLSLRRNNPYLLK